MNIKWMKEIPQEDREMIETKIKEIEVKITEESIDLEEISDEFGGFSNIFFLGKYALKYTHFWDYENVGEEENLLHEILDNNYFECCLQSDGEIMETIGEHECSIELYGYNEDWVVMERLESKSLMDFIIENEQIKINQKQKKKLKKFFIHCLKNGIFPNDINAGSIYIVDDENIKAIDYNLYQTFDYLKTYGFKEPQNLDEINQLAELILEDTGKNLFL